jgi:hypothetical protein
MVRSNSCLQKTFSSIASPALKAVPSSLVLYRVYGIEALEVQSIRDMDYAFFIQCSPECGLRVAGECLRNSKDLHEQYVPRAILNRSLDQMTEVSRSQ